VTFHEESSYLAYNPNSSALSKITTVFQDAIEVPMSTSHLVTWNVKEMCTQEAKLRK
jgi:hypothetical protein